MVLAEDVTDILPKSANPKSSKPLLAVVVAPLLPPALEAGENGSVAVEGEKALLNADPPKGSFDVEDVEEALAKISAEALRFCSSFSKFLLEKGSNESFKLLLLLF